jgi:hypothetical protein
MTLVTGWLFVELIINVASAALEFFMDITQDDSDNLSMVEILVCPVSMARCARCIESGDSLTFWMTWIAWQFVVESVQRPSGLCVCESLSFLFEMAILAWGISVAFKARFVMLLKCLLTSGAFWRRCVAGAAILVYMTVFATQTIKPGMLLMEESHIRTILHAGFVDLFFGQSDKRTFRLFDVFLSHRDFGSDLSLRFPGMAKLTGGVVTPVAMALQALPMVGTLQARLPKIVGIDALYTMTFNAGWNFSRWSIMVAFHAARPKFRHMSMRTVGENHGTILILQLINNEHVGTFVRGMLCDHLEVMTWAPL